MRIFLLSCGLLGFAGLAAGAVLRAPEPPPLREPARLELTPAEVELIEYYVDLRTAELKANPHDFGKIWRKYDDLVRRALPPEKYPLAKPYLGC